jgi:DNA-binding NtrC family response regulator
MIIDIDDNATPEIRRIELMLQPILYAFEKHNYNKSQSAKFLGITIKTLKDRMRKLDHMSGGVFTAKTCFIQKSYFDIIRE